MKHVLVPVDHHPSSEAVLERGLRALRAFGDADSKLSLLYVGDKLEFPRVHVDENEWQATRVARTGVVVREILAHAEQEQVDLILMATEGRHGFLDALRGSTTEQVLHGSPCPVLAVPVGGDTDLS